MRIQITEGNLNNDYFYLGKRITFFPPETIGAGNRKDGEGRKITLFIKGLSTPIETDIDGAKAIFRERAWVKEFFRAHEAQIGDEVIIEKIDDDHYSVSLRKKH